MLRRGIPFLFLLLIQTVFADQLIIEPDMGRAPIIDALNKSKYTINLVMYGMTDDELLDAFIKQKLRGKTLKIILEQAPYKAQDENKKAQNLLNENKVAWHGGIKPFRLIHEKTLLLDANKAMVMTFNFTKSTFKRDRNFALIIDDKKTVTALNNLFSADWNQTPVIIDQTNLIISPDNSRYKTVQLIDSAKADIKIYAPTLSDYKLLGELAKTARRGVNIKILTSANLREKQKEFLTRAGITIAISKKYFIHAKVIIIDNKLAMLGSLNFTKPSFDANREVSVISDDHDVLRQLVKIFEADWRETGNVLAKKDHAPASNSTDTKKIVLEVLKLVNKMVRNL